MAQAARTSFESEPDLVAYDSSSILPVQGSGYSYGPPSDNMSRLSLDKLNDESDNAGNGGSGFAPVSASSPSFSNRSRARASSIASKFSIGTLPLYSAHAVAPNPPTASTSNHRDSLHGLSSGNREHRRRQGDIDEEENGDDDDAYSDESDLEMDTMNKNSAGKGGWKMIANTESPLSTLFSSLQHTHPPVPSMSDGIGDRGKFSTHAHKSSKNSRFERFDRTEWIAMSISLVLVAFLTIASLYICFSG